MSTERRSYFAATVEAALAEARTELGDEALLVESRSLPGPGGGAEGYEVIFQADGMEDTAHAQSSHESSDPLLLDQMSCLKNDLARMAAMLRRMASAQLGTHPSLAAAAERLAEAGFPAEVSVEVQERIARRLGLGAGFGEIPASQMERALATELESRLTALPGIGMDAAARKIVVLAGPPGAGKTTTLAKLAIHAAVSKGLPAAIISTDAYRVAASEQLRSYASILGLPFACAETPGALLGLLEEHRQKHFVLIDTPGLGPRDFEASADWSRLFSARSDIETQLVLSATMQYPDLERAAAQWASFRPARLILTHLDETAHFGGILACAMNLALPVSYLCAGQSVPEDIREASAGALIRLAMGHKESSRAAAA